MMFSHVSYAGFPYWFHLEWSPDGSMLAAVGLQAELYLYTDDLELIASTRDTNLNHVAYDSAKWTHDGNRFAMIYREMFSTSPDSVNGISILNTQFEEESKVAFVEDEYNLGFVTAWTDDDTQLIGLMADCVFCSPEMYFFDGSTLEVENSFELSRTILLEADIVFDHNSEYFAYSRVDAHETSISIFVVETLTGNLLRTIEVPYEDRPHLVFWHANGEILIDSDESLRFYDSSTGELLRRLTYSGFTTLLGWSPDGKWVAVQSDHNFEIWDTFTGIVSRTFGCDVDDCPTNDLIVAAAWHPRDAVIAAGLWDGRIELYDVNQL
jgi:WD40 repeat protein